MITCCRSALFTTLLFLLFLSGCGFEPGLSREKKPPLSADLVIVGDGIGGLTASLEASRRGAAVIVFSGEPLDEAWSWAEGALCPEESADAAAFEELLRDAGWTGYSERQMAQLYERAAGDLAWLIGETGLELTRTAPHRCVPKNLSYDQVYRDLLESARQEGVRFIEEAALEELLISDGNEISGVGFIDPAGVYNHVYAPAVILADGGFLDDRERVEELAPGTVVAAWRKGGGEGLKLAREARLDLVEESHLAYALVMESGQGWVRADPPPGALAIIDGEPFPFSHDRENELLLMLLNSSPGSGYLLLRGAGLKEKEKPDWPSYVDLSAFMESHALEIPKLKGYFKNKGDQIFAGRIEAVASYCLGGIAVNDSGQALRNKLPVEGLYALGETAGALNGDAIIAGLALTEALVWGRSLGSTAIRQGEP